MSLVYQKTNTAGREIHRSQKEQTAYHKEKIDIAQKA